MKGKTKPKEPMTKRQLEGPSSTKRWAFLKNLVDCYLDADLPLT
jgi:hypothetical protein